MLYPRVVPHSDSAGVIDAVGLGADGPVAGQTVLVHGVRGAVGSLAAQLAHRAGATVIGPFAVVWMWRRC